MDPGRGEWDVAIVGTGMGGATLGHALVRQGHRVLFLERGAMDFPPLAGTTPTQSEDPEERIRAGYWPSKITATVDGSTSQFFAPMGCGVGGSTLLWGATLERFERSDFSPSSGSQHGGAQWPIDFDEFLPYYEKAEQLYRVCGTADPLNDDEARGLPAPAALNEFDTSLVASFTEIGLHPYRQHRGIRELHSCGQCFGSDCHRACKSDARTICVEPILASGKCQVVDQCEVTRLEADRLQVQRLVCVREGQEIVFHAKVVVLAAGAYLSPKVLLASRNEHWPRGVGNDQDQVGRNIMFHLSDTLAIWPRGKVKTDEPGKTIGLRDFYRHNGVRLGVVQSMGISAKYGSIVSALRKKLQRSRMSGSPLLWHLIRIPAFAASRILGIASIFATIVEDMAYPENRVVLDPVAPSGIRVEYKISDELRERGRLMRRLLKQRLTGFRSLFLNNELMLNFGHPCGSCRFGTDPRTSVLDPSNRVHGMNNLYVVDASFMPSSAGMNPGLTIAANALRVADIIDRGLQPARLLQAKCVLLDIEGTVSDVRFVHDVMFPFAKKEMLAFLRDNWSSAQVQDAIRMVAADAGISNIDNWLGLNRQTTSTPGLDRLAKHLDELMAKDSKSTGLKQLQGMVWQSGFKKGMIQAELFDDVVPALREWRDTGLDIRIYSSGSILAQTLFFKHTVLGDLSSFFSAHYDTTSGGKKESASYTKIAVDSQFEPSEIVFVSDIYEELVAAQQAGLQVVASIRPNNGPLSTKFTGLTINSFSQLKIAC